MGKIENDPQQRWLSLKDNGAVIRRAIRRGKAQDDVTATASSWQRRERWV